MPEKKPDLPDLSALLKGIDPKVTALVVSLLVAQGLRKLDFKYVPAIRLTQLNHLFKVVAAFSSLLTAAKPALLRELGILLRLGSKLYIKQAVHELTVLLSR